MVGGMANNEYHRLDSRGAGLLPPSMRILSGIVGLLLV